MKYSEVLARLQNLTGLIPSQSQLCDITGVKQSAMSNRAKENSAFKQSDIQKLNDFYGINLYTNTLENNHKNVKNDVCITPQSDKVLIDYYPDVLGSCGTGVFIQSQEKEVIEVPKNAFWTDISLSKHYSMINAYGNSMQPVILDGDKLLIEKYEDEQIIDNRIYVFCYNNEIFIKRLAKNINQLMIMSENEDFDTIKLQKDEMNEVNIIGQVVGLIRNLK